MKSDIYALVSIYVRNFKIRNMSSCGPCCSDIDLFVAHNSSHDWEANKYNDAMVSIVKKDNDNQRLYDFAGNNSLTACLLHGYISKSDHSEMKIIVSLLISSYL